MLRCAIISLLVGALDDFGVMFLLSLLTSLFFVTVDQVGVGGG